MSIKATILSSERAERFSLGRASTLRDGRGSAIDVHIDDMSTTGFKISLPFALVTDQAITIGVPGLGARPARIVRSDGNIIACSFDRPLTSAELALAQMFDSTVLAGAFQAERCVDPVIGGDAEQESTSGSADLRPLGKLLVIFGAAIAAWALFGIGFLAIQGVVALIGR